MILSNVLLYFEEGEWPEWFWQIKWFIILACVGIAFIPIAILLNLLKP
jgi:hypothetical protein